MKAPAKAVKVKVFLRKMKSFFCVKDGHLFFKWKKKVLQLLMKTFSHYLQIFSFLKDFRSTNRLTGQRSDCRQTKVIKNYNQLDVVYLKADFRMCKDFTKEAWCLGIRFAENSPGLNHSFSGFQGKCWCQFRINLSNALIEKENLWFLRFFAQFLMKTSLRIYTNRNSQI